MMFCVLIILIVRSFSWAQPLTISAPPTPSVSQSAIPAPLCASCERFTFTPAPEYLEWQVPANPEYSWLSVYLWGATGGGTTNGVGAYVSGALRVVAGETLRLLVGAASKSDFNGCGGVGLGNPGGGRSAIQRSVSGVFSDVVTAGGGGAGSNEYCPDLGPDTFCPGGHAGRGMSGYSGSPSNNGGSSADYSGLCSVGTRSCGEDAPAGGWANGGGGGGWCGGTAANGGGGGGSSNPSALSCVVTADFFSGNLSRTFIPQSYQGLIVISVLPPQWEPCTIILTFTATSSSTASSSSSSSATATATSTSSPSATATSTASSTFSSAPALTVTSNASSTSVPTLSPRATSTSTVTVTSSTGPSVSPSSSSSYSSSATTPLPFVASITIAAVAGAALSTCGWVFFSRSGFRGTGRTQQRQPTFAVSTYESLNE